MVGLIRKTSFEELDDGTAIFEVTVDGLSIWKFSRFLELIEAYDTFRKTRNSIDVLLDEIKDDYEKDYKKDDDKLW